MSLFFKKNFLCAVFKVHLPLPYCHTCLVPSKSTKRFFKEPGSHLLSHAVSSIVPSAAQVLTIVFGMGTGVSPERIAIVRALVMNPDVILFDEPTSALDPEMVGEVLSLMRSWRRED